jgi:hypothetical protein
MGCAPGFMLSYCLGSILCFWLNACRSVSANTSSLHASFAAPTEDCPSGIFRIICADGHEEFQSLEDVETGRVCPRLHVKVLHDTSLEQVLPEDDRRPHAGLPSCAVERGIELQVLTVGIVQQDQRRRLRLADKLGSCLLQEAVVDDNAVAVMVEGYTLAAGDSYPVDVCRMPGQKKLRRLGNDRQSGKGPEWGHCGGRYKESLCAGWEEIPLCDRLD